MSNEDFVRERKFEALGISEEDFEKLPVEERLSRLVGLKEGKEITLEEVSAEELDARRRRDEVSSLLSDALSRQLELIERRNSLERSWKAYRDAVHEQRVEIGRLAAYSRLYKEAEEKLDVAKMRHYGIKIGLQREKLSALREKVRKARAEFGTVPRLRRMLRQISREMTVLESEIDHYRHRIRELDIDIKINAEYCDRLFQLIAEIDREIAELKAKPKVVRHRYREVAFEIHAAITYESMVRGREAGHDIDLEVHVGGILKSLLPTRYEDNESGWLDEIEALLVNTTCHIIKECADEYFAMPWVEIEKQHGWRCNMVDRRVTRRTIINVSKYYADLKPPVVRKVLSSKLRKELERHTILTITSVDVMRANELRQPKSVCYEGTRAIGGCVKRRREEILEEVVSWSLAEEIDELMRFLSEGE